MKFEPSFATTIQTGKLEIVDKQKFLLYIKSLRDGSYYLKLSKKELNRSNAQNSYYWGVIIPLLSEHFGYFKDEMHEALKLKFLIDDSRELPTIKSTSMLSTAEFCEYTNKIIIFAGENGIYIPEPGENNNL